MIRTPLALLAASALLALSACTTEADPDTEELPVAQARVRMSPSAGGLGMSYTLLLRGTNTQWAGGAVSLDMGPDILVAGVTVLGPNHAEAAIEIQESAQLGFRDVLVTFTDTAGDVVEVLLEGEDGFLVESGGISIEPNVARLGETLEVRITGVNTLFQDGSTWVDFGEGVVVNWVSVEDETHATASVSVDQRADPGFHDVVAFNGPNGWTLKDGLFVDRTAIAIEIDPAFGNQGEQLPFTILGRNTHFQDTTVGGNRRRTLVDLGTSICVNEFWPNCQDTVRRGGEVDVINASLVTGNMHISNGAQPGYYDVRVYVLEEQDFNGDFIVDDDEYTIVEQVILHDGFEVREVPINCIDNPGVSFGFSISRDIDNDSCQVVERVSASATFFTPLDPPCGNPGQMPPPPFDVNGILMPPPPADCPAPRTCDAGPFVYLESELNTIVLERRENVFTGDIGYVPAQPLTLDDYKFGYVPYDLRAEGSDDPTQIPAFTAEDVLWTLPSDFELLEPLVCENFTHDPAQDLPIRWTPASTYDVAGLSSVYATSDPEGQAFQLIAFPWDDGEYEFPSDWLTSLPQGGGYFIFGAGVGEPKWFLDFGEGPVGVENQGSSGLSYRGFMLLQGSGGEEEAE